MKAGYSGFFGKSNYFFIGFAVIRVPVMAVKSRIAEPPSCEGASDFDPCDFLHFLAKKKGTPREGASPCTSDAMEVV